MDTWDPVAATRAGAEALDAWRPEWYREIDPVALDLSAGWYEPGDPEAKGCVLAQLAVRVYPDGRRLGLYASGLDLFHDAGFGGWPSEYGFVPGVWPEDGTDPYALLNDAWRDEIAARLMAR